MEKGQPLEQLIGSSTEQNISFNKQNKQASLNVHGENKGIKWSNNAQCISSDGGFDHNLNYNNG